MAYEEFLRLEQPRFRNGRLREHPEGLYTAKEREAFQKHLTSFIGENGKYSVLGNSDNRRTSKMAAPRGEREKVDARRDGVEDPNVSTTASKSASDTDAPAAAGGGTCTKTAGVLSCLTSPCYLKNRVLRCCDAEKP
jgi:hypothetical protein